LKQVALDPAEVTCAASLSTKRYVLVALLARDPTLMPVALATHHWVVVLEATATDRVVFVVASWAKAQTAARIRREVILIVFFMVFLL
jgi:hypothetical protein